MVKNRRIFKYPSILKCLFIIIFNLADIVHANSCLTSCINSTDYQHPNSFLHFSRSYFPDDFATKDAEDASKKQSWRHRYDIYITQDGPNITVLDHDGSRHVFGSSNDGQYFPIHGTAETANTLVSKNNEFFWTSKQGVEHRFQGSYLTEITSSDNQTLRLKYKQQKLDTITDAQGRTIGLNYQDNVIASLTTPKGALVELNTHVCPLDTTFTETCDAEQHPIEEFYNGPTQPSVSRIDARPVSCESYFIEYFGTTRGTEIETGLAAHAPYQHMQTTVRSFPIVDFVSNDQWIAVRSRDLASPSFNDEETPNALLYRLMRDGRQIQDSFLTPLQENGFVTATEQGVTTTLQAGVNPQIVTLQLVIRHQIATASHWQQITRARELLSQRYDIYLEVVIIP